MPSNPVSTSLNTRNVAGYGKQLGRIGEVLEVLIDNADLTKLSDERKKAVTDFKNMVNEIAVTKARYFAPTKDHVDQFVTGLEYLKKVDQQQHAKVLEDLRKRLFPGARTDADGRDGSRQPTKK